MNNENIDLNQLRKTWKEMGEALGLNNVDISPASLGKMNTALDKLRNRYQRMGIFTLFSVIVMLPILLSADFIAEEYQWPIVFSYITFLSGMACVDFWLKSGVERIDPLTMPVSQVVKMALHYKKCHIRTVMIALPIAICWVGFFIFATVQYNDSVIWGIACGAVIGGAIGSVILRKFMSDYKNLS